jgi:hypothetical protein
VGCALIVPPEVREVQEGPASRSNELRLRRASAAPENTGAGVATPRDVRDSVEELSLVEREDAPASQLLNVTRNSADNLWERRTYGEREGSKLSTTHPTPIEGWQGGSSAVWGSSRRT